MDSLSDRIKALRAEKEQSLQDVASAVGASRAHIWEVETGKTQNPSVDLVRRLADHFRVSVAWLVGEDLGHAADRGESAALYRAVSDLTPQNREIVQGLIDSLLKSSNKTG